MEDKLYKVCLRCGRKLKNPEFRKRGYGSVCWEKVKKERHHKKLI